MQLCCCVSFLVVAGNSSQNENMFLQKILIRLLYYDPLANVCILYNLTLFYSVSLIYFFRAATDFDIFGTDNAQELITCGVQYPSLPISILHFVARIFGGK
jgi:hypothetical protein